MARKIVKVCLHRNCCERGAREVCDALEREIGPGEADVVRSDECFHFCKKGPNVAVDGNVLHFVRPREAVSRVQREIAHPSARRDAVGSRSLDDLDDVLDDLGSL